MSGTRAPAAALEGLGRAGNTMGVAIVGGTLVTVVVEVDLTVEGMAVVDDVVSPPSQMAAVRRDCCTAESWPIPAIAPLRA